MAAPSVRSQREGGVATVMIDREAKRNALDRETLAGLEAALEAAARDPEVRVIVLRGAGDRVFCAGADLAEIQGHESIEASRHHFDGVARVILAIQRAGQPVIARVPGFALAGGFGLAVAADFTVASQSARFGLPEIGIGLLPLMSRRPSTEPSAAARRCSTWSSPAARSMPPRRSSSVWSAGSSRRASWTPRSRAWPPPCSPSRPRRCGSARRPSTRFARWSTRPRCATCAR